VTVSPAQQAYDLILFPPGGAAPIGLMLVREKTKRRDGTVVTAPAQATSKHAPSNEHEQNVIRDVSVVMDSFEGGYGVSQRWDQVPNGYAWGENICARWPRVVIPAGELVLASTISGVGMVRTSFIFSSNVYWITDGGVSIISGSGTANPSTQTTIAAGLQFRSSTVFNGAVYCGGGSDGSAPNNIWRLTGSSTWTEMTDITRRWLTTVYSVTADNVGAYRLWGSDGESSIRYTSGDPSVAGNWSSSIPIGDSTHRINALVSSNRHVWPVKLDGVHDLDELGYSPNLTPYWRETLDTSAGNVAMVHEAHLYAGQGKRGLDRISLERQGQRRDAPNWCQPGFGLPNESPVNGHVTAMCADQGWIVAAVHNPSNGNSYIMYGIERTTANIPGPGPILWHGAEAVILGSVALPAIVTNLRVATPIASNPILWISVYRNSQNLFYKLSLPRASSPLSDWLATGQHRFNPAASLYLTAQDWSQQYSTLPKHVWGYDIRADNLAVGQRTIDVYSNDYGGAYSFEGSVDTSPLDSLGWPTSSPVTTTAHSLGLKLNFVGQTDNPWIFRGAGIRAQVLAKQNEYVPCRVEYGYGTPLRNGAEDDRDPAVVKAQLIALQEAVPFPVRDHLGATATCRMGQGIEFVDIEQSEMGRFREQATFLLRKLT
jgi:hypothetical protein